MSTVPPGAPAKRFPAWFYVLTLVLILVFTLGPLASVAASSWFAEANGCMLNEGSVNPCVVAGFDWGGLLYTGFVMGWLMLATIPIGFMAFLVWLAVLVIHQIVHKRSEARR